MKRQVVKKLLPFLLATALIGSHVSAAEPVEGIAFPGGVTEETGEAQTSEGAETEEGQLPEEAGGEAGESQPETSGAEDESQSEEPGAEDESQPGGPGGDIDESQPEEPGADADESQPEEPGTDEDESQPEEPGTDADESQPEEPGIDGDASQPEVPGTDVDEDEKPSEGTEEGSKPSDDALTGVDGQPSGDGAEQPSEGTGSETEEEPAEDSEADFESSETEGEENYADEVYISTDGFRFTVTWSGSAVITGYTKSAASLMIPAKVTYKNTTYNVEGIGDSAFKGNTTITAVQIAEGPTYIGSFAFSGCTSLQSVTFPSTLKTIGLSAFFCYPERIVQAHNSSYIYQRGNGSLKKLVLPEGLEKIDGNAFWGQPLKEGIAFPNSLKEIGSYAFFNNQCSTLSFGSGLERIGYRAFLESTELRTLMIPGNVKKIESGAFAACTKLNNVSLGNGIQEIDDKAFAGNGSLTTIYIPKSVIAMGSDVFGNITLSYDYYVNYTSTRVYWKGNTFYSGLATVYCEAGSVADNAGNYPSNVEIVHGKVSVAAPTFSEVAYVGGKDIAFSSATKDAVIYYSTTSSNITFNDKWVANGGRVSLGGFNGTVYAKAYYGGQWSSLASHVVKTAKVATPSITVSGNKVTIKCSTSGSTIYYTKDGSTPTPEKGIKANGTNISIDTFSGTVKAIAVKSGCSNSSMARKVLINSTKGRNVSFVVKGVYGGRQVTFNSGVKGAKVYYSSTTSTLTTKDKCVNAGSTILFENFYGTIYARTYYNGEWGNVCRLILKIPKTNKPTMERLYTQKRVRKYNSYTGKYYYTTERVPSGYAILSTSTPSSMIYYTLDGTTPSPTHGRKVNASRGKVYIGTGNTVKAIAVRSCFTNSEVVTYY